MDDSREARNRVAAHTAELRIASFVETRPPVVVLRRDGTPASVKLMRR